MAGGPFSSPCARGTFIASHFDLSGSEGERWCLGSFSDRFSEVGIPRRDLMVRGVVLLKGRKA
jgi:hypothetical protein